MYAGGAERYARIEHDNRILLTKMSEIMQGKNTLDNECEAAKYTHSLNRERRKRELQKITAENQVRPVGLVSILRLSRCCRCGAPGCTSSLPISTGTLSV